MKLGTANVRNFPDMDAQLVAEDLATILHRTTVCGLQEIQPGEDSKVLAFLAAREGFGAIGLGLETPIVWDTDTWVMLDHRVLSFDRPHMPRPQNRYGGVVSAVFRSVRHKLLPKFAVLNTHLVSGGYNGPKLPVVADRWRVEWGLYRDEAIRLVRQGLTVYAVGDLNNPRPPKLRPHEQFQWLTSQGRGPDHIGQLEALEGVHIGTYDTSVVSLHSDHNLLVVSGPLRGPHEN